jgi:hypothetical protein
MRKASIDVKTKHGTRKMYRVEFRDVNHYDNCCSALSKRGEKIIEIRFDDGYPGIDGFKTKNN